MDLTRQYGKIAQIRPDHLKRYQFAVQRLGGKSVLDLACGCGYGSWMLHQGGNEVTGVDIENDAIEYANKYYSGPEYICQPASETKGKYDAIVSFETLEHLDDPSQVLSIDAPLIICSVPNQENYSFSPKRFIGDKYPHKRHYTPQEFEDLLTGAGFMVTEKFSQPTKQGEIQAGTNGSFLIYIGHR